MKKSRFSDEQIMKILSSVTDGVTVRAVCQNHGVSENTFYTARKAVAKRIRRIVSLNTAT
jgi:putative transposase